MFDNIVFKGTWDTSRNTCRAWGWIEDEHGTILGDYDFGVLSCILFLY